MIPCMLNSSGISFALDFRAYSVALIRNYGFIFFQLCR